jgi:hypothetical protein
MSTENPRDVTVQLTADEALVLFEFLQRFSETEVLSIQDQAEERALWNVGCLLEKSLSEPFAGNYQELLAQARDRLRDEQ